VESLRKKVIDIASTFFGKKITYDTEMGDIDEWDSLGHINLFMAIEEEFGKKFPPDKVIEADSIEKIVNLLIEQQEKDADENR